MSDQNQNVVTKGPIKIKPSEIDTRRNELSGEVVGKPFVPSGLVPIAEPRFSEPIPINIEGARQVYKEREGIYDHPRASRPDRPTIVDAEIQPFDNTLNGQRRRMKTVCLEGGALDGAEIDLDQSALVHHATVPTDPGKLQPFVFDPEAHRLWVLTGGKEGHGNEIKGDLDTITYRRTKRKTIEGLFIFTCLPDAPAAQLVPSTA